MQNGRKWGHVERFRISFHRLGAGGEKRLSARMAQSQQLLSHLGADVRVGGFAGGEDNVGGFGDAEQGAAQASIHHWHEWFVGMIEIVAIGGSIWVVVLFRVGKSPRCSLFPSSSPLSEPVFRLPITAEPRFRNAS